MRTDEGQTKKKEGKRERNQCLCETKTRWEISHCGANEREKKSTLPFSPSPPQKKKGYEGENQNGSREKDEKQQTVTRERIETKKKQKGRSMGNQRKNQRTNQRKEKKNGRSNGQERTNLTRLPLQGNDSLPPHPLLHSKIHWRRERNQEEDDVVPFE